MHEKWGLCGGDIGSASTAGRPANSGRDILLILVMAGALLLMGVAVDYAYAKTDTHSLEGGVTVEISYPDGIISGRDGVISILVSNNGWENKQDISFAVSLSDNRSVTADPPDLLEIGSLAEGGSYGESITLRAADGASSGTYYVNLRYTHTQVANNETPQKPFFYDIAVPIEVGEDADVTIRTQVPESIFANAEFPITVEVTSEDVDVRNVQISIIPPSDIQFRGETLHTFSKIERGMPVGITAQIITSALDEEEVVTEYKLPFEIIVTYTDDLGEEKTESQTISLTLRPRTFMELTVDGGIWVGDFFIAPYVSIGTIVGVPAGAIISLLIRRRVGDGRHKREGGG